MSQSDDGPGDDGLDQDDLDEQTPLGAVRVDTAALLLVDPGHLPADVVARLLTPPPGGPAPAVLVGLIGDGTYEVVSVPGGVGVVDPYGDQGYPHESITAEEWAFLTGVRPDDPPST